MPVQLKGTMGALVWLEPCELRGSRSVLRGAGV